MVIATRVVQSEMSLIKMMRFAVQNKLLAINANQFDLPVPVTTREPRPTAAWQLQIERVAGVSTPRGTRGTPSRKV